ncbi:hypothetical protein ERJ75_000927200 [Trypanosoma vivax]|uniref:ODAD1 central coiled coil region domain-containing protein n=1 Tax=Trypanosoma vivax (strain Y486) TaxID=1055687 RepID=G0TVG0_TRYVY|nr:hypothetical protein ERJ75_000927200 [Trypanosoma vivax]CCC47926.1 conserved hypothetical protein [Trypanosoma vivax Y486]
MNNLTRKDEKVIGAFDEDPAVAKSKKCVIDVGQRSQLELLNAEVRHNKETLTCLRLENTQLKIALQQASRGQRRGDAEKHLCREEELLHNKLCLLKRSLNSVRGKKEELTAEIARTVEEMGYVMKEGGVAFDENSAVGQKIRSLENRLDKCLIKHNEVNAIRRTYETLLERLQQEQAGFDTQLAAMEKTLQNTEKDLTDLNAVAADAASGRDAAKAEVVQLKSQLARERRAHNKDVEERRAFVQMKREQLERKSRRLREKMEKAEERRHRVNTASGNVQKKKARVTTQKQLKPEDLEQEQQLREAYNRLKEVTMSANVDEVIAKLRERQDANVQLKRTANEAAQKDSLLKEERDKLQAEWNKIQHLSMNCELLSKHQEKQHANVEERQSGMACGSAVNAVEQRALVRRRVLVEFESHLNDRKNELSEAQRVQEKLGQLLLDVEAGVQHLADTVACTQSSVMSASVNVLSSEEAAEDGRDPCVARGEAILKVLRASSKKLCDMMSVLSESEVAAVSKSLARWRGPTIVKTIGNRSDGLMTAVNWSGSYVDGDDAERFDGAERRCNSSSEDVVIGSRKWLDATAALSAPADEFPENEIHDRNELKMMSIATVERERKKARKQLQQRTKDENP